MKHPAKIVRDGLERNAVATIVAAEIQADATKEAAKIQSKGLKEAAKKIAKANREIANAILNSSEKILEGFSMIADEMQRKRKLDEYFMLLDRIGALEDKIIERGGKLGEIYDSMQIEYQKLIEITPLQSRIIVNSFDNDRLEWLKEVVRITQENPYKILCDLFFKARILKFNYYDNSIWTVPYYDRYGNIEDISIRIGRTIEGYLVDTTVNSDNRNYGLHIAKPDDRNCIGVKLKNTDKILYIAERQYGHEKNYNDVFFYVSGVFEDNKFYVILADYEERRLILHSMEEAIGKQKITYNEQRNIQEFNMFISEVNSCISLGNLRGLFTELIKAERELKMQSFK